MYRSRLVEVGRAEYVARQVARYTAKAYWLATDFGMMVGRVVLIALVAYAVTGGQ